MTTARDGVRLSALRTSRFYSQEILLVLFSVRGWLYLSATVRSEEFLSMNNPLKQAGIFLICTYVILCLLFTYLFFLLFLAFFEVFRFSLYSSNLSHCCTPEWYSIRIIHHKLCTCRQLGQCVCTLIVCFILMFRFRNGMYRGRWGNWQFTSACLVSDVYSIVIVSRIPWNPGFLFPASR